MFSLKKILLKGYFVFLRKTTKNRTEKTQRWKQTITNTSYFREAR